MDSSEAVHLLNDAAMNIRSASKHLVGDEVPVACYLSQQAAEKSLKAELILEFGKFEFTHDLNELSDALPDRWSVKETHPNLQWLTRWSTKGRYYDRAAKFTDNDALRSISLANEIHDSVAAEFKNRGVM